MRTREKRERRDQRRCQTRDAGSPPAAQHRCQSPHGTQPYVSTPGKCQHSAPQTGSLLGSGRGDSPPSPALLGYHHPGSGRSDALGDLGFAGWCKAGGSEPCGPLQTAVMGVRGQDTVPPRCVLGDKGAGRLTQRCLRFQSSTFASRQGFGT